jgi:type IV pilus assembly protein PilO
MNRTGLSGYARGLSGRLVKDPRLTARLVLGLLLAANLVAAAAVFRPWGGSEQELQRQRADLRREALERGRSFERLQTLARTVEKTRAQADQFFERYFLDRETLYSTLLSELRDQAEKSGIKPRGDSLTFEPVEGSDTLSMVTINGNYEGTYADLVEFVNGIDRSPRFLTIERLQAQPAQGTGTLSINVRIGVFVRGEVEPR